MSIHVRPESTEPPRIEPAPGPPPDTRRRGPRSPIPAAEPLPPGTGHALKRVFLGPALPTAQLKHERLGKPTALAVFASDNLSSVAYATEEILKVAVPAVGVLG